VQLGKSRGVVVAPDTIVMPTQPAMFQMSVEMKLQFQVTPNQVLIGVGALLVIGGLLYLATKEAGPLGA
jgi:hypothetical protein